MQTEAATLSSSIPAGAVRWDLPKLNGPQRELVLPVLQRVAKRLICFEGAIRLGKSWGALILVWCLALAFPGIKILIARWKQEDVDGTLTEVWQSVSGLFPKRAQPRWDAAMHAYIFPNDSIVYKKSLKSAEGEARDSKWRGMTLAVIVIDQFEECPKYVWSDIKGRLSQNKHAKTNAPFRYPLHLILLLNAIDEDHWLAEEFPTDNSRPNRLYLTGTVWNNRDNLGEEVIAGLEEDYPVGDPRRRTLLEGQRGVTIDGVPCYEGYFDRAVHVLPMLEFSPHYPLLEGWDFSHARPAVFWAQQIRHTGALHILGGVQGFEMYLEDFVPEVLQIRRRWFPKDVRVLSHCDPAGATNTSGTRVTAVTTLQGAGIWPTYLGNANNAPERYAAIQTTAGLMLREAGDGGRCLRVRPRTIELRRDKAGRFTEKTSNLIVDALQVAYVWDDKAPPDNNPNVRRPKKNHKGDKYSHLMNGWEYIVLGQNIVVRPTPRALAGAGRSLESRQARAAYAAERQQQGWTSPEERRALRLAQRDTHPLDAPRAIGTGWARFAPRRPR
jgi:hypothetical protein